MNSQTEIVRIDLPSRMKYDILGYTGALSAPWLEKSVAEALIRADKTVRRITDGTMGILIWDALRTPHCQKYIWDKYAALVRSNYPNAEEDEVQERVGRYVSNPQSIFRHSTGGAVDVTLLDGDREAVMPTEFDDFSPLAAADYYRQNEPMSELNEIAARNVEILRLAMEDAGFVVLPDEWWHWEMGTEMWAARKSQTPYLTTFVKAPDDIAYPAAVPRPPKSMPTHVTGVAQAFPTQQARAASLAGEQPGYYYARSHTPTRRGLEESLAQTFGANYAIAMSSGLSACLVTSRALAQSNSQLIVANTTYYETTQRFEDLSEALGWRVSSFDPAKGELTDILDRESNGGIPLVWLDQPSNWWMSASNISSLADEVHRRGGLLIADISLHPFAPVLVQGADIAVASLSKYPSNGFTTGGVVLTNDPTLWKRVLEKRDFETASLSADSSFVIEMQLASLADRFSAISRKTTVLAQFATALPGVRKVRLPDIQLLGTGTVGGVFVLEIDSALRGDTAEKIVAHNFHRLGFPLTLQCTFGGSRTTIEYFRPRGDPRSGRAISLPLPNNLIRIGIGNESIEEIRSALALVFP